MLNRGLDKQELLRIVDSVANEKSIDKELILNSMETARTQGSLSHRDWHEPDLDDFDGAGDEPGRLWNDGGTCDHSGGFTGYLGCRFSGCVAL